MDYLNNSIQLFPLSNYKMIKKMNGRKKNLSSKVNK